MRITRATAVIAAVALTAVLASCGSDEPETPADTDTAATETQDADTADEAPEEDAGDELQPAADTIGCDGYEQSSEAAPNVDRWGTCDLDGVRVQLYYIPDGADYDAFMEASSSFGVTEAWVARAGAIVAAPDDQTLVEQLRADLGA